MNKSRLLYTLVVANVFLAFGSAGSEAFFGWTLPSSLYEYAHLRAGFSGFGDVLSALLLVPTVLLAFAGWIGLVSYSRHARRIYLIACALDVLHILISGASVKPAVSQAFTVVDAMVAGTIIGLVYFSELAQRFERPAAVPAAESFGAHRV